MTRRRAIRQGHRCPRTACHGVTKTSAVPGDAGRDPPLARLDRLGVPAGAHACLTISTEISTAAIAPLFSSQWVVFLSSGQPTPGP